MVSVGHRGAALWAMTVALVAASAARADAPRIELGIGEWKHDATGTLASDSTLIAVPADRPLATEQELYGRLGARFGHSPWSPTVRLRYTRIGTSGSAFVDNSTYLGNVLVNLDTTATDTEAEFSQYDGLLYLGAGTVLRGELGGGLKRVNGRLRTVEVNNTSGGGTVVTTEERELPNEFPVYYGAVYVEPASWISIGGEAIASARSDDDLNDYSARVVLRGSWLGIEGGYRLLQMSSRDSANSAYDFEFSGAYAGLSLVYSGAESAPAAEPAAMTAAAEPAPPAPQDLDGDGIADARDACPGTAMGVAVDTRGCALDSDGDDVADARDRCPDTPADTKVAPDGCPLRAAGPPVPDADRDGVPDGSDRCAHTLPGMKVDGAGCVTAAQSAVLQGVTFQVNSSYLMRDSEVLLMQAVEALKAQPTLKVVIQGHTCDLGDAKYNKWLSQRRANRVMEFLVRHGIPASRLLAQGYGEDQPMVPNDDERMRELNRRTVFTVLER